MSKHTQGNWYTKREGYSTVYVFSRIGGGLVQEVAACGPTNEGSEQQEANARLIAAAPELLEACKTFSEWLRREREGFQNAGRRRKTPEGELEWREWFYGNLSLCNLAQKQVRAAIAKATGEQQ